MHHVAGNIRKSYRDVGLVSRTTEAVYYDFTALNGEVLDISVTRAVDY